MIEEEPTRIASSIVRSTLPGSMLDAIGPTVLLCVPCNTQTLVASCDNEDRIGGKRHARSKVKMRGFPRASGNMSSGGKLAKFVARDVSVPLAVCDTLPFIRDEKVVMSTSSNADRLSTAFQALHVIWPKHIDRVSSSLLYSSCLRDVVETQSVDQRAAKECTPPATMSMVL